MSANIKSFTLNLTKVYKGNPTPVTMGCVYSSYGLMWVILSFSITRQLYLFLRDNCRAIGYVLAVSDSIAEIRCTPLGLSGEQAFMSNQRQILIINGKQILSYQVGFTDNNGTLSGYMILGEDGGNIITTENFSLADLEALGQSSSC